MRADARLVGAVAGAMCVLVATYAGMRIVQAEWLTEPDPVLVVWRTPIALFWRSLVALYAASCAAPTLWALTARWPTTVLHSVRSAIPWTVILLIAQALLFP